MPSDSRQYRITPHVQLKARTFGMYGAVEDRINNMARMGIPFTHPVGNRRFHQFLLKIDGDEIVDMIKFTPEEIALYDSATYQQGSTQPAPASTEAETTPGYARTLQNIVANNPIPQRQSYAQQWALRNKKDDTKE
jgi:hypothetical protein